MSKNTLILEDLKDALLLWEDVNMYGEVLFQLSNRLSIKELPDYTYPLVGTELDDYNIIRRAIKNFQGFRHLIENHMGISDPTLFLPRVPKEQREKYPNKLDFFHSDLVHDFLLFPFMLSTWVEYKKVFVMENIDLIKPFNVYEENYLDKLPYGSFILKLNEPVKIYFHSTKVEREFGTILVTSDGTVIDTLFIQSNLKAWCLSPKSRNLLQNLSFTKPKEILKQVKKIPRFNTKMLCEGFAVEISTGLKWADNYSVSNDKTIQYRWDLSGEKPKLISGINGNFHREDYEAANTSEVQDILKFQKRMINTLNGFCKFVAELPPKRTSILLGNSPFVSPSTSELTEWNAIPITNVFYLKETAEVSTGEKILMIYNGGGEKSPHWRRGYFRVYKDGTRIWINKVLVRKDKLETENLKGSVAVIKGKKKNSSSKLKTM